MSRLLTQSVPAKRGLKFNLVDGDQRVVGFVWVDDEKCPDASEGIEVSVMDEASRIARGGM